MNWKKFKNIFKKDHIDESCFVLGIDIGDDSSSISFFNVGTNSPEIIDVSGGYGKPSVPTVMQYIHETKEWVYGEYAVLNGGTSKDITLSSIFQRLGKKEYIDLGDRSVSVANILGLYIKDLIINVKNINPTAEIAGIAVSTPSYLNDESKDELIVAFKYAGFDKELIGLVSDRECILNRYYFNNKVRNEKMLLLDFGSRGVRGGVLDVFSKGRDTLIRSGPNLFDEKIGTNKINEMVSEFFTDCYCENFSMDKDKITPQLLEQINAFAYQHRNLLFQKNISIKPVRLYFNFAYPPFQKHISRDEINLKIEPFKNNFLIFIEKVLSNNISGNMERVDPEQIDTVICTGGGFEMVWAKSLVSNIFSDVNIVFYKNSKAAISEGATIVAATKLGIIDEIQYEMEDFNQIHVDLGIKIISEKKEKFLPIVERNSFWWQKHPSRKVLLGEETDKPIIIPLYKRDSKGNLKFVENIILDQLPERPRGTTKIEIEANFKNFNEIVFSVNDFGFGEMFPSSDYKKKFDVCLDLL